MRTFLLFIIFGFWMQAYSSVAKADIVDETKTCFPNCTFKKVIFDSVQDELDWLKAERGGK